MTSDDEKRIRENTEGTWTERTLLAEIDALRDALTERNTCLTMRDERIRELEQQLKDCRAYWDDADYIVRWVCKPCLERMELR